MPIINRIADFADEMKAWRQHLHANPELLFDTHETAAFVVERLKEFGVDRIETGIGRTGVVGIIEGQGAGPVIGLRADMDALPIQEVRDLPYKSKNPGKMHACGHDGHTTMLLGAARYLAETRNFAGSVALVFQPAEEGGGGGREMVEDGMMEKFGISEVYALHNWPGVDVGRLETMPGPAMAAADQFDIIVHGKGAHAAQPHKSVDTVIVATQIVQALQLIAARNVDPVESVVVSVTKIAAGNTHNVIPDRAEIGGTVRTLSEEVRQYVAGRIETLAKSVGEGLGAKVEVKYYFGYPVTVNDPEKTEFAASVASQLFGKENTSDTRIPEMGAEDFSYMLQARPGNYAFLGNGDSEFLHHPEYDFNDEISPLGASYFVKLVETAQPLNH